MNLEKITKRLIITAIASSGFFISDDALAWNLLEKAKELKKEWTAKQSASAVYGRFRDALDHPSLGYVFVLDEKGEKVLGYDEISIEKGPDSGFYQVLNLPSSGKVKLFAFHPNVRFAIAEKEVELNGRYQEVPNLKTTIIRQDNTPANASLDALIKTVVDEVKRVKSERESEEITGWLLEYLNGDNLLNSSINCFFNAMKQGDISTLKQYSRGEMLEGLVDRINEDGLNYTSQNLRKSFQEFRFQGIVNKTIHQDIDGKRLGKY